jgi:hypothetical protein
MKSTKPLWFRLVILFIIAVAMFDIVAGFIWKVVCLLLSRIEVFKPFWGDLLMTSPYSIAGILVALATMLFARCRHFWTSFSFGVFVVLFSSLFRTFVLKHLVIRTGMVNVSISGLYGRFILASLIGALFAGLLLWLLWPRTQTVEPNC